MDGDKKPDIGVHSASKVFLPALPPFPGKTESCDLGPTINKLVFDTKFPQAGHSGLEICSAPPPSLKSNLPRRITASVKSKRHRSVTTNASVRTEFLRHQAQHKLEMERLEVDRLRLERKRLDTEIAYHTRKLEMLTLPPDDNSSQASLDEEYAQPVEDADRRTEDWVTQHADRFGFPTLTSPGAPKTPDPVSRDDRPARTTAEQPLHKRPVPSELPSPARLRTTWMDSMVNVPRQQPANVLYIPHEVKLSVFSGDPLEWPEWQMDVKTQIHDNPYYTDAQKLVLIKSHLGEAPKSHVWGLLFDGENYREVLKALKMRFGNDTAVIESYIKRVRDWPAVRSSSDIPALCTRIAQMVQVFKSMNFEHDLLGKGLLSDLVSKLSSGLRESWGNYIVKYGDGDPSVILFHDWIVSRERALRLGGAIASSPLVSLMSNDKNLSKPFNQNARISANATSRMVTGLDPSSPEHCPNSSSAPQVKSSGVDTSGQPCPFCEGNHAIESCTGFISKPSADRMSWYISGARCLVCSCRGHRAAGCLSCKRCSVPGCGRKHSSVIHDALQEWSRWKTRNPEDGQANLTSASATGDTQTYSGCCTVDSPAPSATEMFQSGNPYSHVYMAIIPVRVHSDNGTSVNTYAFIDTGCQGSLILESLADELDLQGPRTDLNMVTSDSCNRLPLPKW